MPLPLTPPILPMPIASGGDVRAIPEQTPAGTNQFSFQSGFPAITSSPLASGGIPPQREDFNAACKLLSQHAFFQQSGGIYPWQGSNGNGNGGGSSGGDGGNGFPGLNYLPGAHVLGADGQEYIAIQASGPDTAAGPRDPRVETAYWRNVTRMILAADLNLYVRPDGDDANDGSANDAAHAFKTIKAAVKHVTEHILCGLHHVIINVGAGTYNEGVIPICYPGSFILSAGAYPWGESSLEIRGESKTTTIVNGAIYVSMCACTVRNITVNMPSLASVPGTKALCGISADACAGVRVVDVNVKQMNGAGSYVAFFARAGSGMGTEGAIEVTGAFSDVFSAVYFARQASAWSSLKYNNVTASRANAYCTRGSNMDMGTIEGTSVPTGSVTGYRFLADNNSSINTGGRGLTFFPGTIAGIADAASYSRYA